MVASRACVESGVACVQQRAVAAEGEARRERRTGVALLLRGRRGQNAAAAVGIDEACKNVSGDLVNEEVDRADHRR